MKFSKWHGQGNDFVIVNGFEEIIGDYSEAAIRICNRNFGIGADGLVMILPSKLPAADFQMRIFNSDGSEAEMCGNATRCVARYLYENELTTKTKITLETLAGLIVPELIFADGRIVTVAVDMGQPRLTRSEIPMTGEPHEQAVNVEIAAGGELYQATCVSMGNPHTVIFVENLDSVSLETVGPVIETYSLFPRKTNVEFVQVIGDSEMRMRVWERGAGVTQACGTGASAVLVAAVLTGRTNRKATIHLDGGDLDLQWGADNHIYMSGPAVEVFRGVYLG